MSSATLQNEPSVESFFNVVETETLALFEYLSFEFLAEFDVFAPAETVPVALYNARNTDDPKDIEYRVEDRIKTHSEDVQLKQSTLDETYNRQSGVERTNEAEEEVRHNRLFRFASPFRATLFHRLLWIQ